MKKINYLILLMVVFVGISCEPSFKKEYSWAFPLSGDWKLNTYEQDITGKDSITSSEPFEIKIYNSSFGQDSVWIDDYATTPTNGHYWSMKFKVKADMANKTFESAGSKNAITGYNIIVKVSNGKVIGTDSILMDVEFGDDPGTIYQLKGRRINSYDDYMH